MTQPITPQQAMLTRKDNLIDLNPCIAFINEVLSFGPVEAQRTIEWGDMPQKNLCFQDKDRLREIFEGAGWQVEPYSWSDPRDPSDGGSGLRFDHKH